MSDINEILNVLFAFRLGLPVVWKDYYGSWWEVHRDHTFDFHNEPVGGIKIIDKFI